jgi:hypothetical protein
MSYQSIDSRNQSHNKLSSQNVYYKLNPAWAAKVPDPLTIPVDHQRLPRRMNIIGYSG